MAKPSDRSFPADRFVLTSGTAGRIFATERAQLAAPGMPAVSGVPPVTEVLQYLKGRGLPLQDRVHTVEEAADSIYQCIRGKGHA